MRVRVLYTGLAGIVLLLLASAAAATGFPPKITAVIPDYNPDGIDRLFIVGERLPNGPNLKVKLGDRRVPVRRSEPTLIVVKLPDVIPDGSYRLIAFNHFKVAKFTASIVRDATVLPTDCADDSGVVWNQTAASWECEPIACPCELLWNEAIAVYESYTPLDPPSRPEVWKVCLFEGDDPTSVSSGDTNAHSDTEETILTIRSQFGTEKSCSAGVSSDYGGGGWIQVFQGELPLSSNAEMDACVELQGEICGEPRYDPF